MKNKIIAGYFTLGTIYMIKNIMENKDNPVYKNMSKRLKIHSCLEDLVLWPSTIILNIFEDYKIFD